MRQDLTEIEDSVRKALEVTLRGCDELLPQPEWIGKLQRSQRTGQPLRIKLGLDPTAPDIHLGHTVVLNKMRQLQAHLFTQFVHERCSWFVEGAQAQSSRIDVRPPVLPPCSPPAGGSCRLGLTL